MSGKYLILTPKDLKDSLLSLIHQKENRRYNVVIKKVEDFGDSSPNYVSMREYILQQNPKILLLVGDYDRTPGYPLTRTWEDQGQTKSYTYLSDVYYGMKDGDVVPTIPTGRLCTNDPDILRKICHVIFSYPRDPDQKWRRRVILTGWAPEDPAVSNWRECANYQCIKEIGSFFEPILEYEYDHSCSEVSKTLWHTRHSTEDTLKQAINQGVLIIRYLAHGSEYGWTNIGEHDDILLTDVRNLRLGQYTVSGRTEENWKLPFVISAACSTGKIERRSFAEEWQIYLKAIGIFAADEKSSMYWNERITQRIFYQIVSRQQKRIGDILISAMQQLHKEQPETGKREFDKHTYQMFRYLGDPDTLLAVPDPLRATLREISKHGPALTTKEGKLLIGWVGKDNLSLNFAASDDGVNFFNKVTLGDTSPDAVSLSVFNGKYIVAWTDTGQGNLNVMESGDGITWTNKITLTEMSESAPGITLATHKDGNNVKHFLYLVWRSKGNNQLNIMRSVDGTTWTDKRTLSETTTSAFSVAGFGNSGDILLAWRGARNNTLNIMRVSESLSFSGKTTLRETTNERPHLLIHFGRAYLAWRGMDRVLNVIQSEDGKEWDQKVTLEEKCIAGPALSSLGNHVIWSWTSTDKHLNTFIQDWRL